MLLVLGFFTCGFQLAFITVHLPAYLKDAGLSASIGGWTLAVIGLANAVGSLSAGWLSGRMSKRWLLAWIYFGRAVAIAAFVMVPPTPASCIAVRAAVLFPISSIASGGGPIQTSPAPSTARAKAAFSARNP